MTTSQRAMVAARDHRARIINRLVANMQNCQQITEIGGAQCG